MAWHLEAVGSQGQRGTGDQKTMALAAHLYKKVVDTWNAEEFAKFEFPRIVKEDWPTIYKIKYAMADLLYFQKDWAQVRPGVRLRRRRRTRRRPRRAEAAYASVLCYQNIYDRARTRAAPTRRARGNLPGARQEGRRRQQGRARTRSSSRRT